MFFQVGWYQLQRTSSASLVPPNGTQGQLSMYLYQQVQLLSSGLTLALSLFIALVLCWFVSIYPSHPLDPRLSSLSSTAIFIEKCYSFSDLSISAQLNQVFSLFRPAAHRYIHCWPLNLSCLSSKWLSPMFFHESIFRGEELWEWHHGTLNINRHFSILLNWDPLWAYSQCWPD